MIQQVENALAYGYEHQHADASFSVFLRSFVQLLDSCSSWYSPFILNFQVHPVSQKAGHVVKPMEEVVSVFTWCRYKTPENQGPAVIHEDEGNVT